MVFYFVSHRDYEMYDLLLGVNASSFEEYEVEAKVTKILLDFETAVATSVKSVFLQIKLIFCLIHFTNDPSIMREITKKLDYRLF